MQTKHILAIFAVLLLIFLGIWIASPKVGEQVKVETGVDVDFVADDDELPEELPEGYVRYVAATDAVVYAQKVDENKVVYHEYVGDGKFAYYDIKRPTYFVKTNFDRRIYQVKNADNTLREEYRAYDGTQWVVINKNYEQIFIIPSNYQLDSGVANLYFIKEDKSVSYKLLIKIGETYGWLNPTETDEWISVDGTINATKTDIPNVYKQTADKETIYVKLISFDDAYRTKVFVKCDATGKTI